MLDEIQLSINYVVETAFTVDFVVFTVCLIDIPKSELRNYLGILD